MKRSAPMKNIILFLLALSINSVAQDTGLGGELYGKTTIEGDTVDILIIDGDTLPVVNLEKIQFSLQRNFKSRDERKRYKQWRKYAAKVYPYAAEAIRLYRQLLADNEGLNKKALRKKGRAKEKELKPLYMEELKKLTKSQGFILIKMVERELEMPFYDVIVKIEGRMAAMKWQTLGKWYGYNLKRGYNAQKDPLLESILDDLNIYYGEQ